MLEGLPARSRIHGDPRPRTYGEPRQISGRSIQPPLRAMSIFRACRSAALGRYMSTRIERGATVRLCINASTGSAPPKVYANEDPTMKLKSACWSIALGLAATQASAAPFVQPPLSNPQSSLMQSVRSDCQWVDNKWTYRRGDKRLVCRPDRPRGAGWAWHREGSRNGWYHGGRKEWHFNAW